MTSPMGLAQPTLDRIAAAYAAVVIERQQAFDAFSAGEDWDADLADATLRLGDRELHATLLGSASADDGSWLWAWSNPAFGPQHPAARELAGLQRVGREHDIPELTSAAVPLSSLSDPGAGPELTIVTAACGLLGAHGYHAVPYDGGTAYLAVIDAAVPLPAADLNALVPLMQEAIAAFPHENRLTVETYLGVHGLSAEAYDGMIVGYFSGGREARFELDASDRLVALEISE